MSRALAGRPEVEMTMDLRNLADRLVYRGRVEGVRRTYDVLEGEGQYLVMSVSPSRRNAGNFNLVDGAAVKYVARRFAGQRDVTTKAVVAASRRSEHVADRFDALNILYVLVATDRAKIDTRFAGNQLHFNVKG